MTEHRATPEQWTQQEKWAPHDAESACILELRARLEALEASQHAHADTSRLSAEERRAAVDGLSKPGRWQPLRTEIIYGEANPHAQGLVRDLQDRVCRGELPTDEELLELMPQQLRDDLATVSRLAAHGTSPDVTPGIFLVSLNTGALDYARAVLARWGTPANNTKEKN